MRTLLVTTGTMCLSILLLAVGQRLLFTLWSTSVWDPVAPVESMLFDKLVLYALFPLVVVAGTAMATALARSRQFTVSMVGILPVFIGVLILLRHSVTSLALHVVGYALLCFAVMTVTNRLWGPGGWGHERQVRPRT